MANDNDFWRVNNNTEQCIPRTKGYWITREGVVTDGTGKVLPERYINDEAYVLLPYVTTGGMLHRMNIRVSVLTSCVFRDCKIPTQYWRDILPNYMDDDVTNVDPVNVRHKQYPPEMGFHIDGKFYKYVPCHTTYGIDKDGYLYNTENNRISGGFYNTNNFVTLRPKKDVLYTGECKYTAIGKLRLLGMTYLDYPKDTDRHYIEHTRVNGGEGADNIHWLPKLTRLEKYIKERCGATVNKRSIIGYNVLTKATREFHTITEAARFTNTVINTINRIVNNNTNEITRTHWRLFDTAIETNPDLLAIPTKQEYYHNGVWVLTSKVTGRILFKTKADNLTVLRNLCSAQGYKVCISDLNNNPWDEVTEGFFLHIEYGSYPNYSNA